MKKTSQLAMLSLGLIGTLALAACSSTTNTATTATESISATAASTDATAEATSETTESTTEATSATVEVIEDVTFNYIKRDEVKSIINNATDGYLLLDVRKAKDYNKDHVINSIGADMDAAKDGDMDSGVANLKAALETATGNENGPDDEKYVLLCYSGNRYAEAAAEALLSMGVQNENIYILEGGYKEWLADSNDEYTSLIVSEVQN